jgi:hypothetical protein
MKIWRIAQTAKYLFPLYLLLITSASPAQNGNLLKFNSSSDLQDKNINSTIDRQKEFIKNSYSEKIEAPKELINGKEYESYYTRSKNKPLLFADKSRTASIITKSRRYNNLTLQYDTFLDEVIYTDTSQTINYRFPQIALNKNIIVGFNLYFADDSLIFKYFRLPECSEKKLLEGFYEIVYEGKSKYIIKHESGFYEKEGSKEYKYSPKNYISIGDNFFKIKNRKSLLQLFGEKSRDIKKFMHISRIRFRQADKRQIESVLKFYDSL